MSRPTPLSGFPEWLPGQQMIENHVVDRLRTTFELHGFAPLSTRGAGYRHAGARSSMGVRAWCPLSGRTGPVRTSRQASGGRGGTGVTRR